MVEKKVAAEPTYDDAVSYLISVKEAFHVDPAKFKEFLKLLDDMEARRVDQASFFARVRELIKDHPKLLSGLRFFLPDQANIEIDCDDADALLNKNKVNLNNMVVKKVAAKPTVDDVSSYVTAVLEAFEGEPAKCKYLLNLCCDLDGKRVDQASFVARAKQLFKDHPNLLAGASVLFPDQANVFQIIPPEPEQPTELPDILSFDDAVSYMATVKEAFNSEPAKLEDFLNLLDDLVERRVDEASLNARVGQIFKDHPNLLPGLNAYLPAEAKIIIPPETAKIIIPPEPEQPTELPDNIEIKHKDADHLLNMIKTRFQRLDTDVPNSFLKIMEDFKEGKISEEEVREEVLDLLYYHEDLRREFLISLQ